MGQDRLIVMAVGVLLVASPKDVTGVARAAEVPRDELRQPTRATGDGTKTGDTKTDPGVPFPHPVITEVLFNVPKEGDANLDGVRDAAGDEFIELMNPHAKAINLKGYVLANRLAYDDPKATKGVRFTFPDLELPPGAMVVVFNGFDAKIPGAVGTGDAAPTAVNDKFNNAAVFTMGTTGKTRAFKNEGDFVILLAPDKIPVECVWWGEPDPAPPEGIIRSAEVDKSVKGSVQRRASGEAPAAHDSIDDRAFSPGQMPAGG